MRHYLGCQAAKKGSGSQALTLAVKEKFPAIDAASFFNVFKRCLFSKKINKHNYFFVTKAIRQTRWFMVRSQSDVAPSKTPDDQIAECQRGASAFLAYEGVPGVNATPCTFKKTEPDTVNKVMESLKAKRLKGTCHKHVRSTVSKQNCVIVKVDFR